MTREMEPTYRAIDLLIAAGFVLFVALVLLLPC